MPQYELECNWCRETFISSRPHSRFCRNACKVYSHRILKDFYLLQEFASEEEVRSKYYSFDKWKAVFYIKWLHFKDRTLSERFADVYISKSYSMDLVQRMIRKRKLIGIR